jgi:hypothetical protein
MPEHPASYWPFGVTLVAICIPFFSIIGFLSTKYGYSVWATKTKQLWRWMRPKSRQDDDDDDRQDFKPSQMSRSQSTEDGMRMRIKDRMHAPMRPSHRPAPSHPHIHAMVAQMGEGRQSGLMRMGAVVDPQNPNGPKEMERQNKDAIIDMGDA